MSQRTQKVESLIQHIVATGLLHELGGDMAPVSVSRVDVSPDLRQALVWIGLVASGEEQTHLFERIEQLRGQIQREVAARLTTKYVPRIEFKLDTSSEYAIQMERLLDNL